MSSVGWWRPPRGVADFESGETSPSSESEPEAESESESLASELESSSLGVSLVGVCGAGGLVSPERTEALVSHLGFHVVLEPGLGRDVDGPLVIVVTRARVVDLGVADLDNPQWGARGRGLVGRAGAGAVQDPVRVAQLGGALLDGHEAFALLLVERGADRLVVVKERGRGRSGGGVLCLAALRSGTLVLGLWGGRGSGGGGGGSGGASLHELHGHQAGGHGFGRRLLGHGWQRGGCLLGGHGGRWRG